MHNQIDKAKQELQILKGSENFHIDLDRIKGVKNQMENSGKFLGLFSTRSNRKAGLIIIVLRGFQQLSGIAGLIFYTQEIFKESGDQVSSEIASIILYSVQLVASTISAALVDKVGRRLFLLSLSGSVLALLSEGTYFYIKIQTSSSISYFSYLYVVFLLGFMIFFSLGMQLIPILMLGEVFPANVKVFVLCLFDIYFYIVISFVTKLFQYAKDNFIIFVPFYAFAGICFVGLVFIAIIVPETKGKTLEEIQECLKKKTG